MKTQIIKVFNKLIKLIPYIFRRKVTYLLSESLKFKDGSLRREAFIDFDVLSSLNKNNKNYNIYVESLIEAGDQKSDNIYKIFRHLNLYNYIINVLENNIEGDFAECGCFNGNSLFATKKLLNEKKSSKKIHVFDSFEGGLSEFEEDDLRDSLIKSQNEAEKVKNQFASSFDQVSKKVEKYNNIFLNKGWIPQLFESQEDRKYSFVHVDVDLYKPTYESHKYFYERLSPGGIIVCDDYGYNQFPGATRAVDQFVNSLPYNSFSHFINHSFGTSVIIKSNKL